MEQLVLTDIGELQKHEAIIERGLKTFVEVGQSLLAIRDAKLYREDYHTFEDYCRDRWGMAKTSANRLIQASEVVNNLAPIGVIAPTTESQTRPIASLEPEQQREVWEEVTATYGPEQITAAKVQETVDRVIRPHVSHNSGENEWYTPSEFIEAARVVMGSIDLDPASCDHANEMVKAESFFSKENSGLNNDWYGNVWLNPPYAQPLMSQFAEKVVEQYENYDNCIILVNNATETKWFQSIASVASAICFPQSRIKYLSPTCPKNSPLQGQAFIYLGTDPDRFCDVFESIGICVHRKI